MAERTVDYNSYLVMKEHLTIGQMAQIHEEILKNADTANQDFVDVWKDIIQSAIRYTTTRAEWSFLTNEQKLDKDSSRTSEHNTVINNFIVLERIFKLNSWKSNTWTEQLFLRGDMPKRTRQDVSEHRKRIGDFANYLAFIYAINGR